MQLNYVYFSGWAFAQSVLCVCVSCAVAWPVYMRVCASEMQELNK